MKITLRAEPCPDDYVTLTIEGPQVELREVVEYLRNAPGILAGYIDAVAPFPLDPLGEEVPWTES